jgi:hypothetical protein
VIDPAVNVALLGFRDGALEPGTGCTELTGAAQAVAHLVQASAKARVIDPAVNIALLGLHDGALEPHTSSDKLAGAAQAIAHQVYVSTKVAGT